MSQSLSGQLYIDEKDSGHLLMFVCDHTPGSKTVEVTPVGLHRMWTRGREKLLPLIEAFRAQTLPKLQAALAATNGGTSQVMRPCDVDRFLAQSSACGLAPVALCQWLLSFALLPNDTAALAVARAGLQEIVCPDCQGDRVAGPDEDGCYDCTDCGRCFEMEDSHA